MKAWLVRENNNFTSTVVFAETSGKAKAIAMHTDAFVDADADFCSIQIKRVPKIDGYYKKGKTEMDWYNSQDRIVLVRDCNFYCEDTGFNDCKNCPANMYCETYKSFLTEIEEDDE